MTNTEARTAQIRKGFAVAQASILMLGVLAFAIPTATFADEDNGGDLPPNIQLPVIPFPHHFGGDEDSDSGHNKLIVNKVLVGAPEGVQASDFSFTVTNGDETTDAKSFKNTGDGTGTAKVYLSKGDYTVAEVPVDNYTTTYSGDCGTSNSNDENSSDSSFFNKFKHHKIHREGSGQCHFGGDDGSDEPKTCTITNTYVPPTTSCTFVSDTATQEAGHASVLVSPIHPAWTAVIGGAAKWIWGENPITDAVHASSETFTRTFTLTGGTGATLDIAADNTYSVSVNGNPVGSSADENNFGAGHEHHIVIPAGDLVAGTNTVTFKVNNLAQSGGTMTSNPAGLLYDLTVTGTTCGEAPPPVPHVTVVASKVVCADEKDLPNWGEGGNGPITSTTAADWVEAHPGCHLQDGWSFEWGNASAGYGGNTTVGHVDGYTTFGPTVSGTISTDIPMTALGEGTEFHLREVLQDGYIPFTYGNNGDAPNGDNVSAEFYCSNDVLNYDNFDFIRSPEAGSTYYCVAFNAPKVTDGGANPNTGGGGAPHSFSTSNDNGNGGTGGGTGGQVLGASTSTPQTCQPLITSFLKKGWKNDPDQVKKLQGFLNDHLKVNIPVTGFFGQSTFNAVKLFQKTEWQDVLKPWFSLAGSGIKTQDNPTGFVYQTTKWRINNIWCAGSETFPTELK